MTTHLRDLLAQRAGIAQIATHLDALEPRERELQANDLGGREQRALWEVAADAPRIELDHFVPLARPALDPVHHPGRNTVPSPPPFQRFQKRFCKPRGESARLFGYNVSSAWFVRPGYFVAYSTAGHDAWKDRGGVVIDYWKVPDDDVPDAWPKIVPNSQGLQALAYHRTRDFMRKVSDHVSIGRAAKEDAGGDRFLDFWFTLCRQE